METFETLARLRRVVEEAGGEVDGRKKLQKLVYLCQKAGANLGYSFGFHFYGVYSAELAFDVRAATTWRILSEEQSERGSYRLKIGKEDLAFLSDAGDIAESGLHAVQRLRDEPPGLLEALSTIVYLRELGYDDERVCRMLKDLKGHLEGFFDAAFRLERELYPRVSEGAA